MTIKFYKPTWSHAGFFKYRLDYNSKCDQWTIYRFENSKNYYIEYQNLLFKEESFATLKDAKKYINKVIK